MVIRGGVAVDLDDPKPQDFDTETVARTLAHINRFSGNYGSYSVAQHAVLVASVIRKLNGDPDEELAGLHHDDTEVVTNDMPSPVKRMCPDFRALEDRLQDAIDIKYLVDTRADIVKVADAVVFSNEVRALVPPEFRVLYSPSKTSIKLSYELLVPWGPDVAFARYMDTHNTLTRLVSKHFAKAGKILHPNT
jgi:hypothetical protein